MATLTTQNITRSGLAPTYAAATSGGDAMECGSQMFLHVKNGSGGALTVTHNVPAGRQHESGVNISNLALSVPASSERMIGPIDSQTFADPTTGLCSITYSGVTSLTVAALKLTQ